MILVAVTSEDVCWSIRNVKFINESFYNMRCLVMFITAICVLFLFKKHLFLSIASTPSPPFQCCNTLRGHFDLATTLKRGEGGEMSKLDIEKLTRLTKQVFFGECQLLLSMIVAM